LEVKGGRGGKGLQGRPSPFGFFLVRQLHLLRFENIDVYDDEKFTSPRKFWTLPYFLEILDYHIFIHLNEIETDDETLSVSSPWPLPTNSVSRGK